MNLMKRSVWLFCVCLLCTVGASAQSTPIDTNRLFRKARNVPIWVRKTPEKLALHLTKPYEDDTRKVLAISCWIAKNMRYDIWAYLKRYPYKRETQKMLRRRKALCREYSDLFIEMCEAAGIDAYRVHGYVLPFDHLAGDSLYRADHAWNTVKINDSWQLYDLTWAAGEVVPRKQYIRFLMWRYFNIEYKTRYRFRKKFRPYWFNTPPGRFGEEHHPSVRDYQVFQEPVPLDSFMAGPLSVAFQANSFPQISTIYLEQLLAMPSQPFKQMMARQEYQQNGANRCATGYWYYSLIHQFFKDHYSVANDTLMTPAYKHLELMGYAEVGDSMLELAKADFEREYDFKVLRSEGWKKTMLANNRRLRDSTRIQARHYQKLSRQVTLLSKKRYAIGKRAAEIGERPLKGFHKIIRPIKVKDEADSLCLVWFREYDSLKRVNAALVKKKDSFYAQINLDTFRILRDHQLKVYAECRFNHRQLRSSMALFYWQLRFSLLHEDDLHLTTEWYWRSYVKGDSLQHVHDSEWVKAFAFLDSSAYVMRFYHRNTLHMLRLLKQIKRQSLISRGEEELYAKLENKHLRVWNGFRRQIISLKLPFWQFKWRLKRHIRLVNKTFRILNKLRSLEMYRHRRYGLFRRNIRTLETRNLRLLQIDLRHYHRLMERSLD